jgi:hypothetical protein
VTTAEAWTIAISLAALAVSVGTTAWQIIRARSEAPRVVVSGTLGWRHGSSRESGRWGFTVVVTNVGRSPVTIDSAGWEVVDAHGVGWILSSDEARAAMPVRLDASDTKRWEFDELPQPEWEGECTWPRATVVAAGRRGAVGGLREVCGDPRRFFDHSI